MAANVENEAVSVLDRPVEMEQPAVLRTVVKQNSRLGYRIVKRVFDFASSLLASVILAIPMAIIAILIMIKDPGNPFFSQTRVGQGGKPIKLLKFRSMKKGADRLEDTLTPEQLEEYKQEFKLRDDPRLLGYKKPGDGSKCFGSKLRTMSIDELPQIFYNIFIKGDMSVVGPRPILQEELEKYYKPEERELLLSVKPGLTGYWQAYARNNAAYEDGERQRMEMYYIQNRSLWLDIKIILATVGAIIQKSGL